MSSRDDIGNDNGGQTKRAEPKRPIHPSQCYGFASFTPASTFSIRVSALKISTTSSARAARQGVHRDGYPSSMCPCVMLSVVLLEFLSDNVEVEL